MHETSDRAFPLQRPANIAVLASGRGSNLEALIHDLDPKLGQVRLVITNNPQAFALERASKAGIRAEVIAWQNREGRNGRGEFETRCMNLLEEAKIDLICLAGFMRVLSANFVRHFTGRVLNIHPSLLPNFPGLAAPMQAIEARAPESGCTVHFVDEGVDTGPIILQRRVHVLPTDTAETLAERILIEEHIAYPAAVHLVLKGLSSFRKRAEETGGQFQPNPESRSSSSRSSRPALVEHSSAQHAEIGQTMPPSNTERHR